jgi:hypothetical protein
VQPTQCGRADVATAINRIDVRTGNDFSSAEQAVIFNAPALLFTAPYAVRLCRHSPARSRASASQLQADTICVPRRRAVISS